MWEVGYGIYMIWHNSGCTLAIMAITGHKQNAFESDPAFHWVKQIRVESKCYSKTNWFCFCSDTEHAMTTPMRFFLQTCRSSKVSAFQETGEYPSSAEMNRRRTTDVVHPFSPSLKKIKIIFSADQCIVEMTRL